MMWGGVRFTAETRVGPGTTIVLPGYASLTGEGGPVSHPHVDFAGASAASSTKLLLACVVLCRYHQGLVTKPCIML